MQTEVEAPYTAGEPLTLTTQEGGFPTKRGVEFVSIANGGTSALVKWGLETFNVSLDALSRALPPQPPATLGKWFEVRQPPKPPSEDDLSTKLAERRQLLAKAQERARLANEAVTTARQISQRADREVADARSTLQTLDAHDRADQRAFEEAISLGKKLPERSNGQMPPRQYIEDRVKAAEQAQTKFDRALSDAQAALSDALSQVRRCAANVMAAELEREALGLLQLEQRAALQRAELTAVAGWFPSAEIGLLKVDPATANCLTAPIPWQDQTAVRTGGGWIKPWQSLFDKLCEDPDADFELGQ